MKDFPTDLEAVLNRVSEIIPEEYGRTRNFLEGAVSYLSPYISRGVISTKFVKEKLIERGYSLPIAQSIFQELAWRDFWQKTWVEKQDGIFEDLRNPQSDCDFDTLPLGIDAANTGIEVLNEGIADLKSTGYMHNHLRMYTASVVCNVAKTHWKTPSQWMYYHLLDGDLASNMLSWQWVAGTNSNKKYIANQENINKYCNSKQRKTYLDVSYEELASISCPPEMKERIELNFETNLPKSEEPKIEKDIPILLYNYYNLDPFWRKNEKVNRVLLLEPSVFERFPVSHKCIDFVLDLSQNIEGIQLFVGEFNELQEAYPNSQFIFKEHPLNNYSGQEDPRDWMFPTAPYKPTFFGYWKLCEKEFKKG